MEHLKYLEIVNYVYAALLGLVAFALLVVMVAVGLGGRAAGVWEVQIANAVLVLIFLGIALVAGLVVWTGRLVARARGRVLQTVLAILNVLEFPFGTIYGVYALWVCWANRETKVAFDTHTPAPV